MIASLHVSVPFRGRRFPAPAEHCVPCNIAQAERWVACLLKEMDRYRSQLQPRVVYLGGGEVTALPPAPLEALCRGLRKRLDPRHVEECTVQSSPHTPSPEVMRVLRDFGTTRLSLVVGSGEQGAFEEALSLARDVGIQNIAVDLWLESPLPSLSRWRGLLHRLSRPPVQHLATYASEDGVANDEREWRCLQAADEVLGTAGYARYEQWSYCRAGYACAYTLACWRGEDYLGLGPGAASHRRGVRRVNTADLETYCDALSSDAEVPAEVERLQPLEKAGELFMLGLHLTEGIDPFRVLDKLGALFPGLGKNDATFSKGWKKRLAVFQSLEEEGLVARRGRCWALTEAGRYRADEVGRALL